jgi:hypothetical protein
VYTVENVGSISVLRRIWTWLGTSTYQLIIEMSAAQKHNKTKKSLSNLSENLYKKNHKFLVTISSISELSTSRNPYQSQIQMR